MILRRAGHAPRQPSPSGRFWALRTFALGTTMLLPTPNTTLRRSLDEWFHSSGIAPLVVAEFEDAALTKIAAASGEGGIAVPSATVQECVTRFQLVPIGKVSACSDSFYLITGERRTSHPAVRLIVEQARALAFK